MGQNIANERVLATAIETYSPARQLRKTQEECGELVAAINRFFEADGDKSSTRAMIKEAADVQIMLMQLSMMVDYKRFNKVVEMKMRKLKRQLEEINGSN